MLRLLLAAALLLVMWGALAFGAVYPWAWRPLVTGAAVVGLAALIVGRRHGARAHDGAFLLALAAVAAGTLLQLVPLPRGVRMGISPATERVLLEQDLEYAITVRMSGLSPDGVTPLVETAVPPRPLSINPTASARGLLLLTGFTLFFAGLVRLFNLTGVRRPAQWITIFGFVLALIGIIQKATLGDHAFGGMRIYGFWRPNSLLTTPFGPFVNKNHFAGWMLMGLPLAVGLGLGLAERAMHRYGRGWRDVLRWLSSPDGGRLQLVTLSVFVMGLSLLMTASRSGAGGFLFAMALAGVVVRRRFRQQARTLAAVGLVATLIVVFLWADVNLAARFSGQDESIRLRQRIWSDSLRVVRDFPLTGTGLNTFGTAMLSYQTGSRALHFQEAHNELLQIVVEGGVLLAVPAFAAMVLLVRGIRRRFAAAQDDTLTYWVRVGATVGISAIGLQSLVEFSLQMPGNAALFAVLLAIALHEPPDRSARAHSTMSRS